MDRDRQTDGQTDTWTDTQTDGHTDTDRQTGKSDRHTDRQEIVTCTVLRGPLSGVAHRRKDLEFCRLIEHGQLVSSHKCDVSRTIHHCQHLCSLVLNEDHLHTAGHCQQTKQYGTSCLRHTAVQHTPWKCTVWYNSRCQQVCDQYQR